MTLVAVSLGAVVLAGATWVAYRFLGSVSKAPTLTMDDVGFSRTLSDGSSVRYDWVDCSPFAAEAYGGRAPGVGVVWTCNGKADWMSSEVVDAREVGALVATMNQHRDAALARK